MRPFSQRLFMVLWILGALFFVACLIGFGMTSRTFGDFAMMFWTVAAVVYIPLCLLQFLVLGYGSPRRLFDGP